MVGKHQSTCLNAELTSLWVFADWSSQTCSVRGLTTTVDSTRQELADIFEELWFCGGGISNNANVDIASQLDAIHCILLDTTEELKEDSLLDIEMTPDTWSNWLSKLSVEVLLIFHSHDGVLLLLSELVEVLFLFLLFRVIDLLEGEAGIWREVRASKEYHLEAEIFHTSTIQTSETIHSTGLSTILSLHSVLVDIGALLFLARLH